VPTIKIAVTPDVNVTKNGQNTHRVEDADEEDEPMSEPSPDPEADFPDELLEEGDQIWASGLFSKVEHIRTTATVSDC